jgi:hypothetical protein
VEVLLAEPQKHNRALKLNPLGSPLKKRAFAR